MPDEEIDHELTEVAMDYWVQFARSGDPIIPNRPKWPVYTIGQAQAMKLVDRVGIMNVDDEELCKLIGPGRQQENNNLEKQKYRLAKF